MRCLRPSLQLTGLLLAGLLSTAPLLAQIQPVDWPSFRGANRDGLSGEQGLATSWPEDGPRMIWRADGGTGFSSLVLVAGRLYTQLGRDGDELLAAFDAGNGRPLWTYRTGRERPDDWGKGPRSTPLFDDGLIYAASALGQLHAVKADNGEAVWSHDLVKEYGARVPTWGVSSQPLVEGDLLLFDAGGKAGHSILAFDKKSGALRWQSGSRLPGYSNPIAFDSVGKRQVLFFTGNGLVALAPKDGKELWSFDWQTSYDINAASPIFIPPNRILVSSGYDVGSALLQLSPGEDGIAVKELWRSRRLKNKFSSSVYSGGYLYGFDESTLKCIDATTGEETWRHRGLGHGSLIWADGHLIVLGEKGQLVLVEATPESYREKARTQVTTGKHWTAPTVYAGRYYLRNEQEIVCLQATG